ncbi:MAG TPA: tetratricopeptide repeat protein [Rhodanobacteraceae bacterium]|nr:tetratricopeptide repeat protein [Rhodanobacteraceae bacterium]
MKTKRLSAAAASACAAIALIVCFAMAAPASAFAPYAQKDKAKGEKTSLYPNATRKEPKLDLRSQGLLDKLNTGLDAANNGDAAKARELLTPIAEGREGNSKYARALAQQGLAALEYNSGDHDKGIRLLKKALDNGVLPNDTYFQLMYELAQFYVADQQYDKAQTALQKWRAEGKRETADSYALEGNIDYRLEHYKEAIAAINKAKSLNNGQMKPQWQQILAASYAETGQNDQALAMAQASLAKNPDDPVTLRNTAILLIQSGKYAEAAKAYQRGVDAGLLTTPDDYSNLAKAHLLIAQEQDNPATEADKAIAVLEQGLKKGDLKPGYDVYKLEGDAAAIAMQPAKALKYYDKAAPFAKDGEVDLRRAKAYMAQDKYGSAASAAHAALKKGVKDTGEGYLVLGAAEAGRKHRSAAIAAVKQAAKYPESKAKAEAWLKRVGQ